MDWLTFKFCVLIWVLCVSKSLSQLLNSTSSLSNQLQSANTPRSCQKGQPVASPDDCNSCMCFSGQVYCTNLTCPEQRCVKGEEIPKPDACNSCICRRGKVTCTNMICIPASNCVEKQLYPSQNECNACMCLNGFITCTSNGCSEENLPTVVTTTTTKRPKKKKRCTEGSSLPAPAECLECHCENGRKRCKYVCNQTLQMESRFADTTEPACLPGQTIPSPDDCNHCICFEGEIHCTHRPCQTYMRIGRQCRDEEMVIQFDDCNECYCIEGQLECSNLVCIRGSNCVQGQEIPKPDSCNACVCVDGHIVCTNSECPLPKPRNALIPERSAPELKPLNAECQEGDILPTLPPPHDCNKCFCIDNNIMCTMNSCGDFLPEIKGRLKEQGEQTDLKKFDKQISVEPFIDELYKKKDKLPSKVIHTHAYNGYHQEIKVHAKHLPKDATSLFKVLASSLDNSALASISQKLLTSSDSLSNNPDLKIPFDHQEVQNNILGEGNVLTTQSGKVITSGSQSNETILVVPNTDLLDYEHPESVVPLSNKHETIWKAISSPAPIVYHNNQPIQPRAIKEENPNFYNNDRPPSFLTPIPENDMIRKPTKFNRPVLPPALPTKPTREILELPNVNTQTNPILNQPININDGKINYAPYYPENAQIKPSPSGFVGKRYELIQRPLYQPTKPTFIAPNINGVQQKPSLSQYVPNRSNYYPNQVNPQEFQFKPNQNQPNQILLPTTINKGMQLPPLYPNTPNQPILSTNQYNPPQFGLKPGQGNLLNNIGNQTDQQFNQFPPNYPMNSPVVNLPLQKKRISSIESEGSKEIPVHSKFLPNSTLPATNIFNPQQNGVSPKKTQHKPTDSHIIPNPSIYYKNEFEAPKINEVNSEEEKDITNSNFNQPQTSSELDSETNMPKIRNKKMKYNTTHSHYEKHSTVIYVSEYDPNDPDHPKIVEHDPNQDHNAPHTNEYENNVPHQDSQELDLTVLNQTDPIPGYPNSAEYPNTFFQFKKEGLNDPGFADGSRYPANSVKDSTHQNIAPQTETIQNPYTLGILNDPGSTPGFQNAHNAYKDPRQLKPVHEPSKLGVPDNNLGVLDERGSADGFQYSSNSPEHFTHPKEDIQKPTNSLYGPTQNQHLPGMFDERGSAGGFQYPSYSADDLKNPKDESSNSPFGLTQNQHLPGIFDERGSAGGFQYPSHSADDPKNPKDKLSNSPFGLTQNQHLPGMFDERGSAGGFQYPSHSAEDPNKLKVESSNSPFGLTQNQHLPGMFDERGSTGGFQYPSHSTEDLSHPKQNIQKPNNTLNGTKQNQINKSSHFVPYSSNFYPTHPKDNLPIPPHPQFGPTQNQAKPAILGNRGVKDGYQYGHNANQNPTQLKPSLELSNPFDPTLNNHKPVTSKGFQHPSSSAENPIHSRGFVHTPPQPILGPPQIPHLLGIFNERGSNDSFHNPSNLAENPSHSIDELNKPFQTQFGPTQHQPILGVLDERGSNGGFQYPSNSAKQSTHPKDSIYYPSYPKENLNRPSLSPFGSTQNQHLPSFHNPSLSTGNPSHPKQNQPYSLNGPTQNQHLKGIFDERGSADGFQYPSHSAELPSHPKQNTYKPINSLYGPTQNQHLPGMIDERGSANGFQYPSHSSEDPSHPKQNIQKPTNSLYGPTHNQHLPGMFDERGSADGFQYPSHSSEDPSHPKQNILKPTNSLYDPMHNQHLPGMFDERGSADGYQYLSHSSEDPSDPKQNIQKPTNSLYDPMHNQHLPGMFDERGSTGGFQYPSHSAEKPSYPKQNIQKPTNFLYAPTKNQHLPGTFDERGSAGGFQYPSNSAKNPLQTKDNRPHSPQSQFLPSNNLYKENKQPNPQFGPTQNKHLPGMFDERGSANGFQYPSHSTENPLQNKDNYHQPSQTQFLPSNKQYNENKYSQPSSPFVPKQNQHSAENPKNTKDNAQFSPSHDQLLSGMFDERGSADGFQYPSHSVEDPDHQKNNPDTSPDSQLKQSQKQPEQLSLGDSNKPYSDNAENQPDKISDLHPTNNIYNNNNPLRPWIHLDHDQYNPSSFDNLLNGIHNIPWSDSGDNKEVSSIVSSTPPTKFEPDRDQYKPSSLDNLLNGVHDIPWPIPNQENDALGTDAETTTPRDGMKPEQDQYEPLVNENASLPDHSDENGNDISDPIQELTKPRPEIKPDSEPDNPLTIDDVNVPPNYYDQLYPLFKAVKKLSEPPLDDTTFSLDQIDLLPYLFPGIANSEILNSEPSEDRLFKRISPLSKLKSKLKQLPESGNAILNWLNSKFNKLIPTKYNVTVIKNDIDLIKIFHLLKNFTRPSVKDNAILQDIPFIGYDPEIIKHIINDFQEDILTTTPSDLTDASHSYDNRFKSDQTLPEESEQQEKQIKYPDVHVILHQLFDEDYMDIPLNTPTADAANLATDMGFEGLDSPLFSKMFHPRFRHRPKDQKDECGDGTHWISKCHGCSCYFGRPMCFKMHDCELRPFGEPMTCKPYSHFNMGCYTCECNGDGVAECDSADCTTETSEKSKVSETTEPALPVFNDFFDSKKTDEILQYYNFYKKLPKVCPKQDLQVRYPTCERGTSWVSSCHKCECNESGRHECVKIDDCEQDFDSYAKPSRCKPNSKFYPKTNSMPCVECTCNDEGNPYCPTADYKKH